MVNSGRLSDLCGRVMYTFTAPLPLLRKGVQTQGKSLGLFWESQRKDQGQWVEVREEKVLIQ